LNDKYIELIVISFESWNQKNKKKIQSKSIFHPVGLPDCNATRIEPCAQEGVDCDMILWYRICRKTFSLSFGSLETCTRVFCRPLHTVSYYPWNQ
jgi:hypothetical protein